MAKKFAVLCVLCLDPCCGGQRISIKWIPICIIFIFLISSDAVKDLREHFFIDFYLSCESSCGVGLMEIEIPPFCALLDGI